MTIKIESLKLFPWFMIVLTKCWRLLCFIATLFLVAYWLFGGILATAIFILTTGSFFYFSQDYLLFHPNDNYQSRTFVQTPSAFDLPFQNVFIKSIDGTLIHLYLIRQPDTTTSLAPTIVFLHGNAGNMGHRLHNAAGLYRNLGCNLLMVEYRGYGLSKGFPSEKGIYMDAMAAMDFLAGRTDINQDKIIVFGRSLGGAVAIDLASRPEYSCRIWCLILENTFTSIPDIAAALFKKSWFLFLPRLLYKNKFLSKEKIQSVTVPTLFVSGLSDALVPSYMMNELYEVCGSEQKHLIQVVEGGHNDTWTSPGYYTSLSNFIKSSGSYSPKPPSSTVTDV
ncbi:protein ABHD13 [Halyomorpha halys]|uniref:protein ABHD13 n=1 Tax=Halyomorpha halys TaxID=286706 RepID=UPI0006D51771|nr:protein ABHD13 [Halyomorpha halys]